jgi:putative transposase
LEEKQKHYLNNGKSLNFNNCCSMIVDLKKDEKTSWLSEVNAQTLQQVLMNLETAYGNFFRKKRKFPKFKSKHDNQSFRIPQYVKVDRKKIFFPKFKEGIDITLHRKITGKIKNAVITKTPSGKYFASILCEVPKKIKPKTGKSVGVDLGIKDFIVTSDGGKVKNPNFGRKLKAVLKTQQKHLSRKTKGSNRYNKQKIKVARIYEKITNSRKDFQHKLSAELVSEYDNIYLETLGVKNMMQNRRLSYAIGDASWNLFVRMLEYKTARQGKKVIKIDRFYPSSKTCSSCDYIIDKLSLSVRRWSCPKCGENHDRDINAAKNIHRQGLAITDVEMEALVGSNTNETAVCEASKKRRNLSPKPLVLN